ncbi:hypothetical protein CDAR_587511 [Caerostris darwini]|uniref:Uncharacterized protein n=1 Tax=Caerostris darwini TaxID=1538125 RepID=A0AAV4SIK7_9ARAC|nr:hypothetical protein CDAR_587511 [Caerostris darwini]
MNYSQLVVRPAHWLTKDCSSESLSPLAGATTVSIGLFRNNKLRDERSKPPKNPKSFSRITVLNGRVGLFRNNKLRDERAKSTENPNSFGRITVLKGRGNCLRASSLKPDGKEMIDNNFKLLDTGVAPANGDNDSEEQSFMNQ